MNIHTKIVIISFYSKIDLTNVEVKPKEKTATRDTHSEEAFVNVVHLYLDENALTPDNRVGRLTSPKACARLSVPAFPRP